MARASPDGSRIAFMQGDEGLCVMCADASEHRVLSALGHRDEASAWSPDGRRLAFVSLPEGAGDDDARDGLVLFVVDVESGTVERLTQQPAGWPAWRPAR